MNFSGIPDLLIAFEISNFACLGRDDACRSAWLQEPPTTSLSSPLAHEFLRISLHCWHFHNFLIIILNSVVAF